MGAPYRLTMFSDALLRFRFFERFFVFSFVRFFCRAVQNRFVTDDAHEDGRAGFRQGYGEVPFFVFEFVEADFNKFVSCERGVGHLFDRFGNAVLSDDDDALQGLRIFFKNFSLLA